MQPDQAPSRLYYCQRRAKPIDTYLPERLNQKPILLFSTCEQLRLSSEKLYCYSSLSGMSDLNEH